MKINWKALSVVALAGIMMLGSCKKNEENTTAANGDGILHAGIVQPNNGSRTSLDPSDGTIMWSAGDQIKVNGSSESGTFTLVEGTNDQEGTFRCPLFPVEKQTYLKAAYPAANATISGNEVTFNMPAEQTLTAGTFANGANPMVAYCEGSDALTFKSVMGGIGIRLFGTEVPTHVTKLTIEDAAGAKLWGQFQVADITADAPTASYVSGGSSTITLNLPEGGVTVSNTQDYNFYVVLPVGALTNGFTMEAYDGDYRVKTNGTDNTTFNVVLNTIKTGLQFKAELPAGEANTAAAVIAIIADPEQTGPVTIVSGELDFGGYTAPANQQIIIAEDAEVEISNLNASTSVYDAPMVIGEGANVTLTGVSLTSTCTLGDTNHATRAINIEDGAHVNLVNCTLDGGDASYSRGLNVYGVDAEVNVSGGSIHAGHYAINIPSAGKGVTINLSDASIASGWAAINVWGQNNTINATNCELRGLNDKAPGSSNSFATIAFNADNANCTVELTNCNVYAESTTTNRQNAWREMTGTTNDSFIMHGGTINGTNTNTSSEWTLGAGNDYYASGGTSYSYDFYVIYEDVTLKWNGAPDEILNENSHYYEVVGSGKSIQGKSSVIPEKVSVSDESSKN